MARNPNNDIARIVSKIRNTMKTATSKAEISHIARFAISIIVRRTRLGYGVRENFGRRESLKAMREHSESYKKQRRRAARTGKLNTALTNPAKHNLTFTGQLLDSMKVISAQGPSIVIGPRGGRREGGTNPYVGRQVQKMGWIFNRVSLTEYKQILREYRKTFKDLVRKQFGR